LESTKKDSVLILELVDSLAENVFRKLVEVMEAVGLGNVLLDLALVVEENKASRKGIDPLESPQIVENEAKVVLAVLWLVKLSSMPAPLNLWHFFQEQVNKDFLIVWPSTFRSGTLMFLPRQ